MSNFSAIPLKDILYLLTYYGQTVKDDPYLAAWNFIISTSDINVPISVANWIIKYNSINYISNLPEEIIVKILSDFSRKEIKSLCNSSLKIRKICNDNKMSIMRQSLYNSTGMNFDKISSEKKLHNIYRAVNINDRIYINDEYILIVDNRMRVLNDNIIMNDVENVIGLSGGKDGLLFLRSDGKVYAYKKGIVELLNEEIYTEIPTIINNLDNVIQVVKIYNGAYFLNSSGNVYAEGGSGNKYYNDITFLITNIKEIFSNKSNTIFLSKNGDVYGIGPNTNGELGLGHNKIVNTVEKSNLFKNIKKVFLKGKITTVIDTNDNVYVFGNVPRDRKYHLDEELLIPKKLDLPDKISKINADDTRITILTDKGDLYMCLYNNNFIPVKYNIYNVIDFKSGNVTMILNNKKELYLYLTLDSTIHKIDVNGNIKIIDNQLILLDDNLYFINVNTVTHEFNLLNIY